MVAIRRRLAALLCLAAWSCAGWHRTQVTALAANGGGELVQIWRAGRVVEVHGVRVTADSISGVRYGESLSCERCRISVSKADVDSVRVADSDDSGNLPMFVGVVAAAALLFGLLIAGMSCGRYACT